MRRGETNLKSKRALLIYRQPPRALLTSLHLSLASPSTPHDAPNKPVAPLRGGRSGTSSAHPPLQIPPRLSLPDQLQTPLSTRAWRSLRPPFPSLPPR